MTAEAEILRHAPLAADLSPSEMADLLAMEEADVDGLESGNVEPGNDLLDRYARVFGLSLRRFLEGQAAGAPAAVLSRSLCAEQPSFEDLVATGAAGVPGDFLRCAAAVAELQAALGVVAPPIQALVDLSVPPPRDAQDVFRQPERSLPRFARTSCSARILCRP